MSSNITPDYLALVPPNPHCPKSSATINLSVSIDFPFLEISYKGTCAVCHPL